MHTKHSWEKTGFHIILYGHTLIPLPPILGTMCNLTNAQYDNLQHCTVREATDGLEDTSAPG